MFTVDSKRIGEYYVEIGDNVFDRRHQLLTERLCGRRSLVVTTPTVDRLFGAQLRRFLDGIGADASVTVMALSEGEKTIETVLDLCLRARSVQLGRNDVIVAFGGGVCCDVVTVAAGMIRRGIDYICIPTTLIGQIDAAIGVKGGLNFNGAKSYLGLFHPPSCAWIDPAFLHTLPARAISNGLAEAIKLGLVLDDELFEIIDLHGPELVESAFAAPKPAADLIIERSIALTLQELQPNLFERETSRRLLDFGHTFSPLIEAASSYRLHHGEAVAIDMALSACIAAEMSLLEPSELQRILDLLEIVGLPTLAREVDLDLMLASLKSASSHRGGVPNLVVPSGIGAGEIIDDASALSEPLLTAALARCRRPMRRFDETRPLRFQAEA